jgi:hypothetical protein
MNLSDDQVAELLDRIDGAQIAEITYVKEDGTFGQSVIYQGDSIPTKDALNITGAMSMSLDNLMNSMRSQSRLKNNTDVHTFDRTPDNNDE